MSIIDKKVIYIIELKNNSPLATYMNKLHPIKINITKNNILEFRNSHFEDLIKSYPNLMQEFSNLERILKAFQTCSLDSNSLSQFVDDINNLLNKMQNIKTVNDYYELIYNSIQVNFNFTIELQLNNRIKDEISWKYQQRNFGLKLGLFLAGLESILIDSPQYAKYMEIVSIDSDINRLLSINIEEKDEKDRIIGKINFEKFIQGSIESQKAKSIYSLNEFIQTSTLANELIQSIQNGGPRSLKKSQTHNLLRSLKTNNIHDFKFKLRNTIANGYIPSHLGSKLLNWLEEENQIILEKRFQLLLDLFNLLILRED